MWPATRRQHQTLAPKVGFAYDLTGDNRTVIKGFIGQSRWNSADILADLENPVGLAFLRYGFVSCSATVRPPAATSTAIASSARRTNSAPTRRRSAAAASCGRSRPESSDQQRNLAEPRARNRDRPVGPRVMGLQEHAQRLGRNRRCSAPTATPCRSRLPTRAPTASSARPTTRRSTQALAAGGSARSRLHQSRQGRQRRLPEPRVRGQPPLLGQVDDADSFGYTWSTMAHTAARRLRYGNDHRSPIARSDRLLGDDGIETDIALELQDRSAAT